MSGGSPVYLEVRDAVCEHCGSKVVVTLPKAAAHLGEAFAALDRSIEAHLAQCPNAPKEAASHG